MNKKLLPIAMLAGLAYRPDYMDLPDVYLTDGPNYQKDPKSGANRLSQKGRRKRNRQRNSH